MAIACFGDARLTGAIAQKKQRNHCFSIKVLTFCFETTSLRCIKKSPSPLKSKTWVPISGITILSNQIVQDFICFTNL